MAQTLWDYFENLSDLTGSVTVLTSVSSMSRGFTSWVQMDNAYLKLFVKVNIGIKNKIRL